MKRISLVDIPILFILAFSIRCLITPSFPLTICIVALSVIFGLCEYIKFVKTNDISALDDRFAEIYTNTDQKMQEMRKKVDEISTKMTSVQLSKGFRAR